MSRFLSALKHVPDSHLAQDVCAAIAMCAFILVVGFGLAEISQLVEVARVQP